MCGTESIVASQIFEMEILMDLHLFRYPESGNQVFRGWSDCVPQLPKQLQNKLQQKLQIWYSTFVSYVFETFCEDRTNNLCIGEHKRNRKLFNLWMEFLFSAF